MDEKNTYIIADAPSEVTRLEAQARMFNDAMHEPLAEQGGCDGFTAILDVACGPGTWVHMIASRCPEAAVTGIDISASSIAYAIQVAVTRHLSNVRFEQMNALETLAFDDGSFDLVNICLAMGFVGKEQWGAFLQEYIRVLRPGGVLRWTEGERGFSNAVAVETLYNGLCQALLYSDQSFSATGAGFGIGASMPTMLKDAGLKPIHECSWMLDYSYGSPYYRAGCDHFKSSVSSLKPFLMRMGVYTEEEYMRLYEQMQVEMLSSSFRANRFLVTAWGKKP
ncbi:MAG: hypothetical protein NVS9B9_03240 [Ktedonobacteraceae bacterium]